MTAMTENDDIPDGVPDENEFNPDDPNPHAVPANHEAAMSVEIGVDQQNALIILGILGKDGEHVRTGIPVASALQLAHNITGKCLELLMGPPPSEEEPSGIILPEVF